MPEPNIKIKGRVMADPELRYTANGAAICNVRLSVYAGKSGEGQYNDSLFIDAVFKGDEAEHAAETYHKKDTLIVEGMLSSRKYQDKTYFSLWVESAGGEW